MRIRALMLADVLMLVGKAGIAGKKVSFALLEPALYGMSQFAMKQSITRLDNFFNQENLAANLGFGDEEVEGKYTATPLLEFEVEYQDQLIPVSIEWKRTQDAIFYAFCLAAGTMIYFQFINYYAIKLSNAWELRQTYIVARDTANVAKLQQETATYQLLLQEMQERIMRSRTWIEAIDDADEQLKLMKLYSPTWDAMAAQADQLTNFDDLPKAQQQSILNQIEIQKKYNIGSAELAAKEASAIAKKTRWSVLKGGFVAVDTGIFLGTGVLRVLLPALGFEEGEMKILNDIFGEDFVNKYQLRMPLGISDLLLIVAITNVVKFFGDDLESIGIPATPEAALVLVLGLMGDYWKVVVSPQQLLIDLTSQESVQMEDMTKQFFDNLLMQNMANPYVLLEGIIAVLAVKALAVVWVLPALQQLKGIQAS